MQLVSREQWGARPPTSPLIDRGPAAYVFIHHTVTADIGDEKAEIRSIQLAHQQAGARDIDYGFLCGRTGIIYEGRGWGKQDGATGQDKDPSKPFSYYYDKELTIAFLGNYENLVPSKAQIDAVNEWLAESFTRNDVKRGWYRGGHRDVRATACPGKHLYNVLDQFTGEVGVSKQDVLDALGYDSEDAGKQAGHVLKALHAAGTDPGDGSNRPTNPDRAAIFDFLMALKNDGGAPAPHDHKIPETTTEPAG